MRFSLTNCVAVMDLPPLLLRVGQDPNLVIDKGGSHLNKGVLNHTFEDLIVTYLQKCYQQNQFTGWELGFFLCVCVCTQQN